METTLEKILKEVSDKYAFMPEDLDIIKEAMVKYAVAAISNKSIALEVMLYEGGWL